MTKNENPNPEGESGRIKMGAGELKTLSSLLSSS